MENCNKKPRAEPTDSPPDTSGGAPPREGFPLPETIILSEILGRLELESLCTLACVCRNLRSTVSQALPSLPSLDLSAFPTNGEILGNLVPRLRGVKKVTIDCLHLNDRSLTRILGPQIQELNLLKCALMSYNFLSTIGEKCPNLRILVLELAGEQSIICFMANLIKMLTNLICLEHLSVKVRGTEADALGLASINLFLPKTLKFLKLQPLNEPDATSFVKNLGDERVIPRQLLSSSITPYSGLSGSTLLHLSLVLNFISDRLLASISSSLPLLVELELEDRPCIEPQPPIDLTNNGLHFLGFCKHLTHLSIVRSRMNFPVSFKKINDLGMLLLAESCGALESVRLGGFSKVTDAGFSSLLHSSHKLKKLEIRNAPLLSDLAFHAIVSPLVELKLLSCNLITSESMAALASSSTLESLDTNGCRSIADTCIDYISCLGTLTSLNLGGADITDSGLNVLTRADLPLTNLSLRGCARVTDRGIVCLFNNGVKIKKTLSCLDIGYMPGITDRAIHAIISNAEVIAELCMRYCFRVTDASLTTLASGRYGRSNLLQKLDICHCTRFSVGPVELLQKPSFRGLRWFGVSGTSLVKRGDFDLARLYGTRPWLTVCFEGCEIGCYDGWHFHK